MTMKKNYITPAIKLNTMTVTMPLALSKTEKPANPSIDGLSKKGNDASWYDEEEDDD